MSKEKPEVGDVFKTESYTWEVTKVDGPTVVRCVETDLVTVVSQSDVENNMTFIRSAGEVEGKGPGLKESPSSSVSNPITNVPWKVGQRRRVRLGDGCRGRNGQWSEGVLLRQLKGARCSPWQFDCGDLYHYQVSETWPNELLEDAPPEPVDLTEEAAEKSFKQTKKRERAMPGERWKHEDAKRAALFVMADGDDVISQFGGRVSARLVASSKHWTYVDSPGVPANLPGGTWFDQSLKQTKTWLDQKLAPFMDTLTHSHRGFCCKCGEDCRYQDVELAGSPVSAPSWSPGDPPLPKPPLGPVPGTWSNVLAKDMPALTAAKLQGVIDKLRQDAYNITGLSIKPPSEFYGMGIGYLLNSPASEPVSKGQGKEPTPSAGTGVGYCGRITRSGIPCDLLVGHREKDCKVLAKAKPLPPTVELCHAGVFMPCNQADAFMKHQGTEYAIAERMKRHDANLRTQEQPKQPTEGYESLHASKGMWNVINLRGNR